MESVLYDAAGHPRSPATMPGYHQGRPPRNKGMSYPADPPTVEARFASRRDSRCAHSRPKAVLLHPPGDGAFTDGQPSLLLRVRRESEPGSVDVLACRAK